MSSYPSVSWDETSPAGNTNASLGDNRIRELKTQIREIIDVDHDFPSSGQATDNGQHKRVTLQEQADLGTGAVGTTILGSQTIATKGELVYTDEDDNDIQLTKAGVAYPSQSTVLADWSKLMGLVYPVGSIYINASVDTNPATLLGVGTWVAFGTGRVMVCKDGSDADFDTLEETGGAKTHTLTTDEMPAHTHSGIAVAPPASGAVYGDGTGGPFTKSGSTASTGGGDAHNNVQPYIVVNAWKRTA